MPPRRKASRGTAGWHSARQRSHGCACIRICCDCSAYWRPPIARAWRRLDPRGSDCSGAAPTVTRACTASWNTRQTRADPNLEPSRVVGLACRGAPLSLCAHAFALGVVSLCVGVVSSSCRSCLLPRLACVLLFPSSLRWDFCVLRWLWRASARAAQRQSLPQTGGSSAFGEPSP